MNKVDVDASVDGGGPTGQAGAVRVAISRALRSFVGKDMLEQMRIGKIHAWIPAYAQGVINFTRKIGIIQIL